MKITILRRLRSKCSLMYDVDNDDEYGWCVKMWCPLFHYVVMANTYEGAKKRKEELIREDVLKELESMKERTPVRIVRKINKYIHFV